MFLASLILSELKFTLDYLPLAIALIEISPFKFFTLSLQLEEHPVNQNAAQHRRATRLLSLRLHLPGAVFLHARAQAVPGRQGPLPA